MLLSCLILAVLVAAFWATAAVAFDALRALWRGTLTQPWDD